MAKIPTRKKRFKIICPDCGQEREKTYATWRMIQTGRATGKCKSCGIRYRGKKRKAAYMLANPPPVMPSIQVHGCMVSEYREKHDTVLSMSRRCARYHDCVHWKDCLEVAANPIRNWDGFTSNGAGFISGRRGA